MTARPVTSQATFSTLMRFILTEKNFNASKILLVFWYLYVMFRSERLSEVRPTRIFKRHSSIAAGHRRTEIVGSRMPNPQQNSPIGRTSDELDARNRRRGVRHRGGMVLR